MSGLLGGLINASKSLAAQEASAQTAGRNLANVNNPAYSRQRVQLSDLTLGSSVNATGSGVQIVGIQQIRDTLLDASVGREISQTSLLQAKQSALQRAEANLGESIDASADSSSIDDNSHATNGISSAVNDFFNGWEELSASPADTATRQLLLQKASSLADKLNISDTRLASLQTDLNTQIGTDVDAANTILQTIGNLNTQISQIELQSPGAAIDLRDQRQAKIEQLSQYMDVTAREIPGSHGQIQVIAHAAGNVDVPLVSKNAVRPISFDGTNFSGGSPVTAWVVSGGSLAGNLSARDGAVQTVRDQLSALARQLTTSVNAAYNPTASGQNFFVTAPTTGLLQVNTSLTPANLQTSTTSDSGANDLALSVSALATKKFSVSGGDQIDGSPIVFLANAVSGLGGALNDVDSKLDDQKIVQTMVTNQRDSISGVSMDEELADLMRFQRAYQASSKVISTLDTMLDELMNSFGH